MIIFTTKYKAEKNAESHDRQRHQDTGYREEGDNFTVNFK